MFVNNNKAEEPNQQHHNKYISFPVQSISSRDDLQNPREKNLRFVRRHSKSVDFKTKSVEFNLILTGERKRRKKLTKKAPIRSQNPISKSETVVK